MRQNIDFDERYNPATLLLMWRQGGIIRLDRSECPYNAFYEVLKPMLRPEDFEIYPSVKRSGKDETCWHIGLRFALLKMRNDKHPEDGRVRYLGRGLYEMTDKGRNWLESYLYSSDAPFEWLELKVEKLDDKEAATLALKEYGRHELHHFHHPMNGDDVVSFIASSFGANAYSGDNLEDLE